MGFLSIPCLASFNLTTVFPVSAVSNLNLLVPPRASLHLISNSLSIIAFQHPSALHRYNLHQDSGSLFRQLLFISSLIPSPLPFFFSIPQSDRPFSVVTCTPQKMLPYLSSISLSHLLLARPVILFQHPSAKPVPPSPTCVSCSPGGQLVTAAQVGWAPSKCKSASIINVN